MDIFIEYMVKKKNTGKDAFIKLGIFVAALILIFFVFAIPFLGSLGLLVAVGIGYGAYYLITSRNLEFEYCVTNDEMDIDKIISQRKRKRILSVSCKDFEILAPAHDERFKRHFADVNVKKYINAMSSMDSEDLYFAIFDFNGQKTRLLFEPDERMINAFRKFIPRKMHIKGQ